MDIQPPKIYVINMDKNKDRLINFTNMMNQLELKFERYNAVNGYLFNPTHRSKGEYGCFMSHKNLWEKILEGKEEAAIIFEDDCIISPKYSIDETKQIILEQYQNSVNRNNDIFYLGKCLDMCNYHVKTSLNIVRTYHPLCTHAYILTKQGARVLLNRFKDDGMEDPKIALDNFMAQCINRGYLKAFASHPSVFIQNTLTGSTIRSNNLACFFNTKECSLPYHIYWYLFLFILLMVIFLILILYSKE
ncbi:MAG: glycosyltransferase family 25 protein, partial [Nitrososphaeraceae archaeon]